MADKYSWSRIYKNEEYYQHQIADDVAEHVCAWFGVEDITDLTEEQISEVIAYREELNEYSVMQVGYSDVINLWENEQY